MKTSVIKWRWVIPCVIFLVVAILLLTVCLVIFLNESLDLITVNTPVGSIQGIRSTNDEFDMFLGIPYAAVNTSNPFGASTPYPNFNGVFIADDDSRVCPQIYSGEAIGVLDCLHLSVFVPDSAEHDKLPVMMWFHGGSFHFGSNRDFGAKYLIKHDVIVVTVNYRLGPYGFMCLDIPEVPGNQGLKDQVLALRWVRDNIEAFGGDTGRITVFGSSAGGHSIDFHVLSETEILFNNAIIQSGSSMSSTVFAVHNKNAPIDIAAQLGYVTSSISEALSFLSTVDTNTVLSASAALSFNYKPCTEMKFENVEPFLTTPWINADTPKAKDVSFLIGYNEQERLLWNIIPEYFDENAIRNRLLEAFHFNEDEIAEREKNIREFFLGDEEVSYEQVWDVIDFDSDYMYVYPIQRTINKYLESGASNVFYYMFGYSGGRNLEKTRFNVSIGSAGHGDEVGYLFDVPLFEQEPTPEDQLILDRMTTMWTNFAKYSDPTPEVSSLLPVRWIPITERFYNYLSIRNNLTLERRPIYERMAFLELFYRENDKFQKGFHRNE